MEEENFMVSIIAAIIGVLPILFLSIIACERKKSRRASSKRKLSTSDKCEECEECERFDEKVDAAIKLRRRVFTSLKNGKCYINGRRIKPKRCEHGNGRDIIIDRPGLQMSAINGNLFYGGTKKKMAKYNKKNAALNVSNSDSENETECESD